MSLRRIVLACAVSLAVISVDASFQSYSPTTSIVQAGEKGKTARQKPLNGFGSLKKLVEQNLREKEMANQGWHIREAYDAGEGQNLIWIPFFTFEKGPEFYTAAADSLGGIIDGVGLEQVPNAQNKDFSGLLKQRQLQILANSYPALPGLITDHLAQKGKPYFGLEDPELLFAALCSDYLRRHPEHAYLLQPLKSQLILPSKEGDKLHKCAQQSEKIEPFAEMRELWMLYFEKAIDERAEKMADYIKEQFQKQRGAKTLLILYGSADHENAMGMITSQGIANVILLSHPRIQLHIGKMPHQKRPY